MTADLRIAIDAQFQTGGASGGIEQFTAGLLHGLAEIDGPERYVLVCPGQAKATWEPFVGSNMELHIVEPRQRAPWVRSASLRRAAHQMRKHARRAMTFAPLPLPDSGGVFESLGVDVVHFPHQLFRTTDLPSIYNPHDLQHRALPQFFSRSEIAWRNSLYAAGCRQASAIVVSSLETKTSLLEWLDIDEAKVHLIRHACPEQDRVDRGEIEKIRKNLDLPEFFAFFPAALTWPHKNHIRLLDALHQLREESSIILGVVFTGTRNEHWSSIGDRIAQLELQAQVHFPGYLDAADMAALYQEAAFLILPSLFEGTGLPILEALANGTPIACSNIDVLREYAGDAAVYFDPWSTRDIAATMKRLVNDADLRSELGRRSREKAQHFPITQTAKTYRALYRHVAGLLLDPRDARLIAASLGEAYGQ